VNAGKTVFPQVVPDPEHEGIFDFLHRIKIEAHGARIIEIHGRIVLFKCPAAKNKIPVTGSHQRLAVEDEAVVPADHVHVHDGHA